MTDTPSSTSGTRTPGRSAGPTPATAPGPVWRDHQFRLLWAGETISQLGVQMGMIAMPVIAIELLRASELQVGVLNAAGLAAFLLVGLPTGAWVDRMLKRRTMIRADLARAAAVLVVPVLWYADVLAMWHLYLVAAVIGIATVFFDVSYQSYVPVLVRPEQVPDANGKLEATAQVARVAGPGVGGGLLKVVSAPLLLLGDAVGYLASAACLSRVRDHEVLRPSHEHGSLRTDIVEGLHFVWRHDLIRRITLCTALTNLSGTLVFTLTPLLILRVLGMPPWLMGVIYSVGAVGGILAALVIPWLGRTIGEGTLIPVAAVAMGLTMGLQPASTLAPGRGAAVAVLVVAELMISFTVVAYNVMQVSMRQRVCPPRLLGRMNASIRFLVWGVMPIGALAAGAVAAAIGVVPAMWIGVVAGLFGCTPVVFSRLVGMRTLPDRPEEPA